MHKKKNNKNDKNIISNKLYNILVLENYFGRQ